MRLGTSLGLTATENAAALRETARALEDAGLDFLSTGGHVLAAKQGRFPERPDRLYAGPFYEPFVLYSHLAAVTSRLHFRNSVLILPLRQTAIVAQQAAELSILSGGRFELGVGLSWNRVEYRALGSDASTRGRRLEEQITLLRRLWTEPLVEFEGRWHDFDGVGLNRSIPPIPIWIGSGIEERPLRRVARFADGWLPTGLPSEETLAQLRAWLVEEGRDPSTFPITLHLVAEGESDCWVDEARRLEALGATELALSAPRDLAGAAAQERVVEATRVLRQEFGD